MFFGIHVVLASSCDSPKSPVASATPAPTLAQVGFFRDSAQVRADAFVSSPVYDEGSWITIDDQTQSASWYDSTGLFLGRFGGRGGGPGEFSYLQTVFPLGSDTVAMFDGSRRLAYLVVGRQRVVKTISFADWPIDPASGDKFLGRTKDGRWFALVRTRYVPKNGVVLSLSDSPSLISGFEGRSPTIVRALPTRRTLLVTTAKVTQRVDLNEVSPAALALCASSVVYADSAGVRVYDVDGRLEDSWSAPAPRIPLRSFRSTEILDRALRGVPKGEERDAAIKALRAWLSSADSLMNDMRIDSEGTVWFAGTQGGKTAWRGVAPDGTRLTPIHLPDMVTIGAKTALRLSAAKDDLLEWDLRQLSAATTRGRRRIGPCGAGVAL